MTLSFLERIARAYGHPSVRVLFSVLVDDMPGQRKFRGDFRADGEAFLNAAARERVASLCRVPDRHLRRALPAWGDAEPAGPGGPGPAIQLRGGEKLAAWGYGCRRCTAPRVRGPFAARVYLPAHQRVCHAHQRWLPPIGNAAGGDWRPAQLDLAALAQVSAANRRHLQLLARSPVGTQAFAVAQAVVGFWWEQRWSEEHMWSSRVRLLPGNGRDPGWWEILTREAVTYPETVTVAVLLADASWQQRVIAEARGHLPHSLGDAPLLLAELSVRLERPWLAARLSSQATGPLYSWLVACVRGWDGTAYTPGSRWKVPSAYRPRPLEQELADYSHQSAPTASPPQPRRRRGNSLQSDLLFATGAAHARAYAHAYGNLATRIDTVYDDFPLGRWLGDQRVARPIMPADRVAVLTSIDPWWVTPWNLSWQRTYHRAAAHVRAHGPLDARQGFPGTDISLGEWLYNQCTGYDALHPEQRQLLAQIAITADAASHARPRRPSVKAGFEKAYSHASSYAATYGNLTYPTKRTLHEGFPLGRWLDSQRRNARRHAQPSPRALALEALDPWWNPPWELAWQRSYHHARTTPASDQSLSWTTAQQRSWARLDSRQHELLITIGITPHQRDMTGNREPAAYRTEPAPRPTACSDPGNGAAPQNEAKP